MGGAETLHAHGLPTPGKTGTPNYDLLWQLLHTTRMFYRYLALAILVIMGIWGTYLVELRIGETSSTLITRLAWAVTWPPPCLIFTGTGGQIIFAASMR